MGGDNPMNEKDAEPRAEGFWIKRNWPIVIGILAVTLSLVDWEYRVNYIDRLKSELAATQKRVRDLTDQLSRFQSYANSEYYGNERQALILLANELGEFDKLKTFFRPLDAPTRQKAVAGFRRMQAIYGTNPIQVELTGEIGNTNLNLVVDELASILREAGFVASVGRPQVRISSNAPVQIEIGRNPGEIELQRFFANAMLDGLVFSEVHVNTNMPQTGRLTVHLFGDPRFSADGHVSFKGESLPPPGTSPADNPRARGSDVLATRSN